MTTTNIHQADIDMLDKLTLQDAVTIVAIHAGQVDPNECRDVDPTACQNAIQKIRHQEDTLSIFDENPEDTVKRINFFVNCMQTVDPGAALDKASAVIKGAGMAQPVFEAAARIALPDGKATLNKRIVLDRIASCLAIETKTMERLIDQLSSE